MGSELNSADRTGVDAHRGDQALTPFQRTAMDILDASPVEQLAFALRARIGSSLHNGQCVWLGLLPVYDPALTIEMQNSFGVFFVERTYPRPRITRFLESKQLQVLAIEEDLTKALSTIRSIRNTFAPINKLHPELLASITTFVDEPFGRTVDCPDLQFFCATVCHYWRNSLLAFPWIWSSVDTTNLRHMKLYLARSKSAPLYVNYGWMTGHSVFERHITPELHRLQSLSIPLGDASHQDVTQSLPESAESLSTLDMWTVYRQFPIPIAAMEKISRFAPNITVLRLHDITTSLSSLKFPALVKLTFRITKPTIENPDAADLVKFLRQSPILEVLDLRLSASFKGDRTAGTVALAHLKSAVFNGSSTGRNNFVTVTILPYLVLPKQSITVDVQTGARAFSPDTLPLLSVGQLGDAVFPQQSITAAKIHIRDDPFGFFGHISICGERNNWIGMNHVRVLNLGKDPLSRLHSWLGPLNRAPLRRIQTLTLGLFEFISNGEQCVEVLRTSLQELDQVRVLNVYKMDLSLVAQLLQPLDGSMLFPLLEELKLYPYDPPELARSAAHDGGE